MTQPRPDRRTVLAAMCALLFIAVVIGWQQVDGPPALRSQAVAELPKPKPSLSPSARPRTLDERVAEWLNAQSAALLRQDEQGFLRATSEPGRAGLLRDFRNLTAMRTTLFAYLPQPAQPGSTPGQWQVEAELKFCFATPACVPDAVKERLSFQDTAEGLQLQSVELIPPLETQWFGEAQPWQTSELTVLVGDRVLVATTSRLKGRLPGVLAAAEKAMLVSDTFSVGRKPDLYRIYLADRTEWRTWHGGEQPKWAAAYTTGTGPRYSDIVINAGSGGFTRDLDDLLRHEMTHAATLSDMYYWKDRWWLIEGIADLAAHPAGLRDNDWKSATHDYVRHGWDGRLPSTQPADDEANSLVGAKYGIAFLAVKRLDERFGRENLQLFFHYVIDSGYTFQNASVVVFNTPWSEVESDCLASIRKAA